jgi:autotransporter passenger strand-loop-strand repeat protein
VGTTVTKTNSPFNVSAGHSDAGDVVLSGGSMFVLSGGVANTTTVSSGGTLTIDRGGTEITPTVAGGGTLTVLSGGALEVSGGVIPSANLRPALRP